MNRRNENLTKPALGTDIYLISSVILEIRLCYGRLLSRKLARLEQTSVQSIEDCCDRSTVVSMKVHEEENFRLFLCESKNDLQKRRKILLKNTVMNFRIRPYTSSAPEGRGRRQLHRCTSVEVEVNVSPQGELARVFIASIHSYSYIFLTLDSHSLLPDHQ